jgi:hypothetical protein
LADNLGIKCTATFAQCGSGNDHGGQGQKHRCYRRGIRHTNRGAGAKSIDRYDHNRLHGMRVESVRSGALMSDRDHVRNTRRRVDGIRKNMQMKSGDDVRNTRRYDRTDSVNDVQSENYSGYGRNGVGCWYCGEHNHVAKNCRHGNFISCNRCHEHGHKERFCNY